MNSGRSFTEAKTGYNSKSFSSVYARQPPRILIVDITPPFWSEISVNLCEALENVFSITCSLAGTCRVPLFSLYVVQSKHECLLPFLQVKGNFHRLHLCIAELRSMPQEGITRQKPDTFRYAIEDGLQQFKQYAKHMTAGGTLNNCSVEITVMTSQPGKQLVKHIEAGISDIDLVSLRRLEVVHISRVNSTDIMDIEWSSESSPHTEKTKSDDNCILGTDIDLLTVENECTSLETFFKAWLHDHGTDKEHLHLLLPTGDFNNCAAVRNSHGDKTSPMCLKCDMQERLLSPALLPGTADITVKTENIKDFHISSKVTAASSAPQYKLRVIRALKSEGVCASVIYGLPLIIRPTNCWQLDWDELETNHQTFHALCHILQKRECMLLARCEPQTIGPSWNVAVSAYYVILPSSSLTLLLKPVAAREILLPCELPVSSEEPPEAAINKIENALECLEVEPTFNPLNIQNNLYKHLKTLLTRGPHRQPVQHTQRKEQQQNKQNTNKVKATVAPLAAARMPANPPKSYRPALTLDSSYDLILFSDDDEF